jgi:hypothetical protein
MNMSSVTLKLADHLSLPLDAVTRTFGILAVRGAGKSNTAAVMAEEMFKAQLPFCVVDPVGSWYGLRSSADGKRPGLSIPIFGGKHGDVPLERGAGELIADLIVEKRLTCVLDLSRFESESDKKAFLLAFARRLYQKNENPLHLFLEEADDYIPQSPMGDEKVLLRAWENIVRRGRARGIGLTLITQRSAAIAKMVLTQVETLFAMRTTGPQDIAAIEAWVKYHQVGKDVLSTLSSLNDGEAWVWSPHFLKTMARHQIRRRETFDSGATPKNVHAKDTRPPATLADIDLASLEERMKATIEKAKADDPRELRKQIAELRKELAGKVSVSASKENLLTPKVVEKPVLKDSQLAAIDASIGRMEKAIDRAADLLTKPFAGVREQLGALTAAVKSVRQPALPMAVPMRPAVRRDDYLGTDADKLELLTAKFVKRSPSPQADIEPAGELSRTATKVIVALGRFLALGVTDVKRNLAAGVAKISPSSSGYDKALRELRDQALITYPTAGVLQLTTKGRALAPSDGAPPTSEELIESFVALLDSAPGKVLRSLAAAYPAAIERVDLAERSGISATSSGYDKALRTLRDLGLAEYPMAGHVRASDELFA